MGAELLSDSVRSDDFRVALHHLARSGHAASASADDWVLGLLSGGARRHHSGWPLAAAPRLRRAYIRTIHVLGDASGPADRGGLVLRADRPISRMGRRVAGDTGSSELRRSGCVDL